MTVRAALVFLLAVGLTGCVTSGDQNPLKTDKGRDEARDAYIQLGLGYLQRGNTEQAKVPLRKALEIDPSSADAHAALAVVFQTEMEPKLADEEYRKALASDSRNARVLNNYGGFLYEQKRYEEAYQRLLEASQDTLYPERSRVFENLGLVSLQMKKPAQAKEYFEKSLRLNRNQPSVALEMRWPTCSTRSASTCRLASTMISLPRAAGRTPAVCCWAFVSRRSSKTATRPPAMACS